VIVFRVSKAFSYLADYKIIKNLLKIIRKTNNNGENMSVEEIAIPSVAISFTNRAYEVRPCSNPLLLLVFDNTNEKIRFGAVVS